MDQSPVVTKMKATIAFLLEAPPLVIRDQNQREYTFTGEALARLVFVDPANLDAENMATPQVVAELGRFVAMAKRYHDRCDRAYRVWRDARVMAVTTSATEASAVGFDKVLSVAAADKWIRTTEDYSKFYAAVEAAEEAWSTLHATLKAAELRTWATAAARGGDAPSLTHESAPGEGYQPPAVEDAGDNRPSGEDPKAPGMTGDAPPPPPPIPGANSQPPPPPPPPVRRTSTSST